MKKHTPAEFRGTAFGWFLFALAALFYCYEYLLRIAPSVMCTELMQYYSLNATGFGNLFAVYYYIYTPMQIPVGLLLDRYGSRFLLTFACLICAIGTFVFSVSHILFLAQIGRFLVGLGSAFAFVGVLKVSSIWLPPERFGMVAGLTTALGMVGAMFGGNIMANLVQEIGWQQTLYGSGIFGLILTAVMGHYLRDSRKVLTEEVVVQVEKKVTFASLFVNSIKLLRKPQMLLVAFIGGVLYTSLSVFAELWGIPYLHQAKGFTTQMSAALMSLVFLGWAIGGPIVGYISDKMNDRRLPLVVGSVLGACVITAIIYENGWPSYLMALLLFLFGVFSSAQNLCFAIAKESTVQALTGSAIALTNMFVMLMGALLQPIVGYILDMHWNGTVYDGVHYYSNEGFQYALLFLPVIYFSSALLAMLLKKRYIRE